MEKVCKILSDVIMLILIIIAALMLVPRLMGYGTYAVISSSMEPNIPVGSIVYDKDVKDVSKEVSVGDVVTYAISGDTMVTHRVTKIDTENKTVTTKGDANDTEDVNPISYDKVIGKVAFTIPILGYIAIYGRTKLGIAAVCAVVFVLVLLNFLPELFKKEEENKKEETNK
ncbi:signal peptidase, endoplasmic reticulum-type [Acetitomaculum ruminis DSM 5522]|uniref:Signal peptidase I n=1 Tax=Acetitomaculum ruminis DSM 5522 TaxID=1120918 RepID=A0A1I0XP78_9FIRM|nr:signal peptidase I [Acetitomaculum ruminis]SFB02939.1 signal peptidase, endoplasmic reticulum-type [Acetitomaculum ruminis DSM 5522]